MPGGSNHPGNPINNQANRPVKDRSSFSLSDGFLSNERFGDVSLIFAQDSIRTDSWHHRVTSSVRSYTLKTPFVGTIRKHKASFHVPLAAILPLNYDKVLKQPVMGDDIVDGVNCAVKDFPYKVYCLIDDLWSESKSAYLDLLEVWYDEEVLPADKTAAAEQFICLLFLFLTIGEYFYSSGNILSQSGYNIWKTVSFGIDDGAHDDVNLYFDQLFDAVLDVIGVLPCPVSPVDVDALSGRAAWRRLFERFHDDPSSIFRLSFLTQSGELADVIDKFINSDVSGYFDDVNGVFREVPASSAGDPDNQFNFGRLAAYQMACHHFFSNDHIDYIFSADLYRQLVGSYVNFVVPKLNSPSSDTSFEYNGLSFDFDYLSGHYFDGFITARAGKIRSITSNFTDDEAIGNFFGYFAALFSFRKSLRYVDYFVGARAYPLAIGDYNVPVSGEGVSIIDVIHKNAAARLANFTNRARNRIDKWLEAMFPGIKVPYDYHNPQFLVDEVSAIYGSENENTGAAQYQEIEGLDFNTAQVSTTSKFKGNDQGRFAYEFAVDMPGFLICVSYYDIARFYTHTRARQMMAYDRMEMFQPFMQYTGDQPIYLSELLGKTTGLIFGYQQKDMQYKQSFNRACGAFAAGLLPSWFFDDEVFLGSDVSRHIGPGWIRSRNVELDKFYLSLTGWSLSSYFHFINVYENDVKVSRPMSYNPGIL